MYSVLPCPLGGKSDGGGLAGSFLAPWTTPGRVKSGVRQKKKKKNKDPERGRPAPAHALQPPCPWRL